MSAATEITRLTSELADLEKRYPSSTAQTGLVLMKRIVRIRRKLIKMGAARERVACITFVALNKVQTIKAPLFDNPYDLDQLRLVRAVERSLAGAGYGGCRIMHWDWAA
jgi:hypothetical protein